MPFSVALYYEPAGDMVCVFEGQQGGVTHIAFSPDGTKLYSGGRKVMYTDCNRDTRDINKIVHIINK